MPTGSTPPDPAINGRGPRSGTRPRCARPRSALRSEVRELRSTDARASVDGGGSRFRCLSIKDAVDRGRHERRSCSASVTSSDWLDLACGAAGIPCVFSSLFLEHEPVVLEQLPLEADLVGAHPGGEREPEVGAGEPAREELKLEQRLSETGRADPPVPLADGLDVVEPAARACQQTEMRFGAADELLLTIREATSRETGAPRARAPTRRSLVEGARAARRRRSARPGSCWVPRPSSGRRTGRRRAARSRSERTRRDRSPPAARPGNRPVSRSARSHRHSPRRRTRRSCRG